MSWLANLSLKKNKEENIEIHTVHEGDLGMEHNEHVENLKTNKHLYISIDMVRVCFLTIYEGDGVHKVMDRREMFLGPIEDLQEGEQVRDVFGSLLKLFTAHTDVFEHIDTVSVSLPADGVFFKNVEVPNMGEADMQKLVLAEIKKTLPVDFSQVLFAQNDLGERHDAMKTFFCVIIQKSLFDNYRNLFSKFNVNPYFELEVFSLARIAQKDETHKVS
jgi:hypothetical protein